MKVSTTRSWGLHDMMFEMQNYSQKPLHLQRDEINRSNRLVYYGNVLEFMEPLSLNYP